MAEYARHQLRPPAVNYNCFFNPNLCHVCKSENQSELISCNQCHMISYCYEHILLHQEEHQEICKAILEAKKRVTTQHTHMTLQEQINLGKKYIRIIKLLLNRQLKPYELQMLLFAKSCHICHNQTGKLVTCEYCKCVDMCIDHKFIPNEHDCKKLRFALNLNLFLAVAPNYDEKIPEKFLNLNESIYDMKSFIRKASHSGRWLRTWPYQDYMYSDNFSQPLTLFSGMRLANLFNLLPLSGSFIVHVMAGSAQFKDIHSLLAWEFILHKLHPNTSLIIELISPKLTKIRKDMQVCQTCIDNKKKLQYVYYPMSYFNYVCASTTSPHIIMGFHAKFRNSVNSERKINALQYQRCPVILTSESEIEAQQNIIQIQKVLGSPVIPIVNKQNKFASCKPCRNCKNGSVFFPNQHLIVYRHLQPTSDSAQVSSSTNE